MLVIVGVALDDMAIAVYQCEQGTKLQRVWQRVQNPVRRRSGFLYAVVRVPRNGVRNLNDDQRVDILALD